MATPPHYLRFTAAAQLQLRDDLRVDQRRAFELLTHSGTRVQLLGDRWIGGGGMKARIIGSAVRRDEVLVVSVAHLGPSDQHDPAASRAVNLTLARQQGLPRLTDATPFVTDATQAAIAPPKATQPTATAEVVPQTPSQAPPPDILYQAPHALRDALAAPPSLSRHERIEEARSAWKRIRLDRYRDPMDWARVTTTPGPAPLDHLRKVFDHHLIHEFSQDPTNSKNDVYDLVHVSVALGLDHGPRSALWARTLRGAPLGALRRDLVEVGEAFERLRDAQPQAIHWCNALRRVASETLVVDAADGPDLDQLRQILSSVDSGKALAAAVAWARTGRPTSPAVAEPVVIVAPAPPPVATRPPPLPSDRPPVAVTPAPAREEVRFPEVPPAVEPPPPEVERPAPPPAAIASAISEPLMPHDQARAFVNTLVEYVELPRARQQARACGLLGRTDAAEVKRLLPDAEAMSDLVAGALNDRARHQCALATLAQLANAAVGADRVDPRGRTLLRRAQQAVAEGEWDRLERVTRKLDELWREGLRAELADDLLWHHRTVVACLARDSARLLEALRGPHPTAVAAASEPPPGDVEIAAVVLEPLPIAPPLSVAEPADVPIPPPAVVHDAAPPDLSVPLLEATTFSDRLFSSWERSFTTWQKTLTHETSPEIRELFTLLAPAAVDAAACPSDPASVGLEARRLLQGLEARVGAITAAVQISEQAYAERLETLARALGVASETTAIRTALADVGQRVNAAVTRLEPHEATLGQAQCAELERLVARDFAAPPEDVRALEEVVEHLERDLAQRQREEEQQTLATTPDAPEPLALEDVPEGLSVAFTGGATLGTFPSAPFLQLFLKQLPKTAPGPTNAPFLPVDMDADASSLALPNAPQTSGRERVNQAAHALLFFWSRQLVEGASIQRLLVLQRDAAALRTAGEGKAAKEALAFTVLGLTLLSSEQQRSTARVRRLTRDLLRSRNLEELTLRLRGLVADDTPLPGMTHALAGLIEHGFDAQVEWLVSELTPSKLGQARRVTDALASAMASLGRSRTQNHRRAVLSRLGMNAVQITAAEDYLEDSEGQPGVRRGARPARPADRNEWSPLALDFVDALGERLWERGRDRAPRAVVNVSLNKSAEDGVPLLPGESSVEIPLLIRSGGTQGVGGILITVQARGIEQAVPHDATVEVCIPWLSDVDLKETSAYVLLVKIEVNPEELAPDRTLRLSANVAWVGGTQASVDLDVRIGTDAPVPAIDPIVGYEGWPLDLDDDATFRASPKGVRDCLTKLRDKLRNGEPVHAIIHGRRRRGKSSISRTLERDPLIRENFVVRSLSWDGPRMKSAAKAFAQLVELISRALLDVGMEVSPARFDDLTSLEDMSGRYLQWIGDAGGRATKDVRVLLVLDEFQKWIADLVTRDERGAILTALRHFTQGATGRLHVSFVLSGLQSLRRLADESPDFAAQIDASEIEALTRDETNIYLRDRLPFATDERTRLRLFRLSGGNPFVLNRLGGALITRLRERRRVWCTVEDLDHLLETQAADGRLDAYLKYMICKDEEEAASTLPELTVLRAVAGCLHRRADYEGHVRVPEVESWLKEQQLAFEERLPQEHLDALVGHGILRCEGGTRFFLPGEWLCRQLATTQMTMQPVTRRRSPDLVLNRYVKMELQAKGGQATVWRARNEEEGGHDVILKIYPLETADLAAMIRRERELLVLIDHPCVVKCRGGSIDEQHGGVLILDYVKGLSLSDVFQTRPASAVELLPGGSLHVQLNLLTRIADGVAACHAAGVTHKDITPPNIMVVLSGGVWTPVIVDFGLAGTDVGDNGMTSGLGNHVYTAPEKLAGHRRTPAADVYSLGVVFTELLTGSLPPGHPSMPKGEPPAAWTQLPEKLQSLLTRMLATTPSERPSAREVTVLLVGCTAVDTWQALHAAALDAYLDSRFDDAVAQLEKAFGCAPADGASPEYDSLLVDTADIVLSNARGAVPWVDHIFEVWLRRARNGTPLDDEKWGKLVKGVSDYAARMPTRELASAVWTSFIQRVGNQEPSATFGPLVTAIERSGGAALNARDLLYDILVQYHAAGLFDGPALEKYCMHSADVTRVSIGPDVAYLWSERARSVGIGSEELEKQSALIRKLLARTNQLVLTPPSCAKPRGAEVGEGEKGHLDVDRIIAFAAKLIARFPWVCAVRRVTKDGRLARLHLRRPKVLRLDQLASHLPNGVTTIPNNLIPIVLDESYAQGNAIAPLRMNIVLEENVTPAQREKAREILASRGTDFLDVD